ncbi:MAG: branched-chain amino acid ABC transporter permease [Acidimicrobiia bacterium]
MAGTVAIADTSMSIIGFVLVDRWLLHTLIGVSFGLLLFLVSSGFTLTFGLARFVTLSHGATFLFAAHVAASVDESSSFAAAVGAAVVAGLLVSLAVFALAAVRWRTVTSDPTRQVLFTFGCLLIISDVVRDRWGGIPRSVLVPAGLDGSVELGGSSFPLYRVFVMAAALVVAAGLWWLQERTRFGALVRAGADDREQLEAMGVRTSFLNVAVFGLSGALAGLAAGLGAPILGASVGQEFSMLIFALVAVVIGGLGSLKGALIASVVVGLVDAYGKAWLPTFASFTVMALVVVVLAIRPHGLIARGAGAR